MFICSHKQSIFCNISLQIMFWKKKNWEPTTFWHIDFLFENKRIIWLKVRISLLNHESCCFSWKVTGQQFVYLMFYLASVHFGHCIFCSTVNKCFFASFFPSLFHSSFTPSVIHPFVSVFSLSMIPLLVFVDMTLISQHTRGLVQPVYSQNSLSAGRFIPFH